MKIKNRLMAWMIVSNILGLTLSYGEAAQAGIRPCLGEQVVGGIDFSDCKMMSAGNPKADVERFKLSLARQLKVMIALYNTTFAVAYGPRTVNGIVAVRYEPGQTQVASSISNLSRAAEFSSTRQLGYTISAELLDPR